MSSAVKYPPEPVEFVRMLVRAFYSNEFVVITDALLRVNNWSNSHNLSKRLRIQPKELRQMLTRMAHARLVRTEKRMQRVQSNDERKSSRNVNTDFWYMPIPEILDVFIYRVHLISKEVEKKRSSMIAKQKYVCRMCNTQYDIIDIVNKANENGQFICDRMGVRPDRRHFPCGGLITEFDTSNEIKETERLSQMLTVELRPLRERADVCAKMDIPQHPLGDASDEVWGELVPETIGANGERVDQDGMPISSDGNDGAAAKGATGPDPADDDGAIPDRPNWFKDNVDEDADADWDTEQDKVLNTTTGTAATLNDDEAYYERYLRSMAGLPEEEKPSSNSAAATGQPATAAVAPTDTAPTSQPESAPQPTAAKPEAAEPNAAEEAEHENVYVSVGGKQVKFSEVTDEMHDRMTDDEYKEYAAIASRINAGDDDDMDDEFE